MDLLGEMLTTSLSLSGGCIHAHHSNQASFLSSEQASDQPGYSGLGKGLPNPKGPKYLYGTKYGFCSSNFPYGLGKYSPYGYLGPFGKVHRRSS